jgi:hypothetical protein
MVVVNVWRGERMITLHVVCAVSRSFVRLSLFGQDKDGVETSMAWNIE